MGNKSIRAQVIELGRQAWESRSSGWQGCPLVNPLCPDDLYVLPKDHVGTFQGWHMLGTDQYDDPMRIEASSVFYLYVGHDVTSEQLCDEGWRRQRELFPEDFR